VKTVTVEEFHAALKAQEVPRRHAAFICPLCNTAQSMDCLIRAGAGKTEEDVDRYIGFSCVGRWTGAGSPRKEPDGKPCNWTLGGLFKAHKYEVVTPDGKTHPHFEPACPVLAQALMRSKEATCKCGATFQPSYGEHHRCPTCMGNQLTEAERALA
jgi:hypothetical protein